MGLANGVHHIAICTKDIKAQIEFFTDVLGAELKALYWMHGVEGAWHGFLRLNDASYVAFVETPEIRDIEPQLGVSHAATTAAPSAAGTLQHLALGTETKEELMELRDRIRSRGVNVLGPIEHGMCTSIYFAGPEGLNLEISWSESVIDERAWIDPEVVELAGIDAAELQRFIAPAAYHNETGAPVPQPAIDPSKPHMGHPPEIYEAIMSMPDEMVTDRFSETEPPVEIAR
ncbi:MAG: VOC family protein [Actinomycetota bacterium]